MHFVEIAARKLAEDMHIDTGEIAARVRVLEAKKGEMSINDIVETLWLIRNGIIQTDEPFSYRFFLPYSSFNFYTDHAEVKEGDHQYVWYVQEKSCTAAQNICLQVYRLVEEIDGFLLKVKENIQSYTGICEYIELLCDSKQIRRPPYIR